MDKSGEGSYMRKACRSNPWLALLGLFAVASAIADGPIPPRFATTQISTEQWNAYLAEVKALPEVRCKDAASNQYICDSSSQRTIWVFTHEGHPAHPAVSRGALVIQQTAQGATVGIDRSGHYAGDRSAFDVWMKEFAPLDQRQVAQWQSMLQPK
jgi:hypothetical protein